MNIAATKPPDNFPEATKPPAPVVYCFSVENVMSALAMASSALACKNRCLKAALEDSAKLAACNTHLLQQTGELRQALAEERLLGEKAMQSLRGRGEVLEQQWATAQQQLAEQAQYIRQKDEQYAAKVKMLEQVEYTCYCSAVMMFLRSEWLPNPVVTNAVFSVPTFAKVVWLVGQLHIFLTCPFPAGGRGFVNNPVFAGCGLA
jgi:hypothetical protein